MDNSQDWRREKKSGSEVDAFSPWSRRFLCWGRGTIKGIKKGFNRRYRRQNKQKLKGDYGTETD